jgi:hypothetical protein
MKLQVAWVLLLGLLLVVGTLRGEERPEKPKPESGRDAAIAEIKKLGGSWAVDEQSPGKPVIKVLLSDTQITDAGLEHLKGLTSLKRLDLYSTQITDAGLEHLKGLTGLQSLDLRSTQITDAGLEHLKGLTSLKRNAVQDVGAWLDLSSTRVTDTGIKKLQEALPNCRILH